MLWDIGRKVLLLVGKSIIFSIGSGIAEKPFKKPLYSRFVVEENFAKMQNLKERQKYCGRIFLISIFSMLPAALVTFVGFDFSHPFSISMFCIMSSFELLALLLLFKLFRMELKYQVFRKKHIFGFLSWIFHYRYLRLYMCSV